MNHSIIRYVLGTVLKFEAIFLCLPLLVGLFYREKSVMAFLLVIPICLMLGFALTIHKSESTVFYALEGFITVSLSWIALSFFGALPFYISGEIPHFTDAVFEAVSGFTTTGATILSDVEVMSHCCLFWRSFTHWIGGMGVLVFVLAVFPMRGGQVVYLMKAESPGPSVEKLVPRVKTTAVILYGVYTFLTFVEFIMLAVGGMPIFDAVTLALGTAGTGGFGVLNDSVASYAPHLQVIITIFMILFGVNFNIYYLLIRKKFGAAIRSEELRVYLAVIALSGLTIAWNIRKIFPNPLEALRHAFFQVASIITTTGFSTADFDKWPRLSATILIFLMLIGACAGSTGGGIKISRIIITVKTVRKELFTVRHPHGVRSVRMDGRLIEHETVRSVNVFLISYMLLFAFSVLAVSLDDFDLVTNFTAVAATINNIGPGFAMVGPMENFSHFSVLSKYILIFDMLAGRLELLPMMLLLSPATWRKK